jgi:hypothetical protein
MLLLFRVALIWLVLVMLSLARADESRSSTADRNANPSDPTAHRATQKRSTAREKTSTRRPARPNARKARLEAKHAAWLEKLKERGVEAWPENETDEEHAAALKSSREMVDEVVSLFPGMQLAETERFLFVSNIPPQQVGPYVASLDRMYEWMCRLFGVERDHKVWLGGKAPIFAFLEKEQFDSFEERYFPEAQKALGSLGNVYGLSHLGKDGEVVIACYRGNDPNDFAQMLVHETSHGFMHRYKTKADLPNWVAEGMADLIGAEMVPTSMIVKNREYKATQQLGQKRSLGGMLSAERIEAEQYGMASNLNRFLLHANRQEYVRFVEALKEGMKWDEALQDAYRSTPAEMLAQYGRWIGVANLRP